MTERGLPIATGAPACPFVAFDDARDDRADHPDPRHRCYAESPPSPRARAHQEAYCLSATFPVCPTFQDWARREAARVQTGAAGGSPAERLRDVPAQREAGSRPPAFGAAAGPSDGPSGGPPGPATVGGAHVGPDLSPEDAGEHNAPTDEPDENGAVISGAPSSRGVQPDARDPWDLPVRRQSHPDWSSPPPWAAPRGPQANDEAEAPAFLRAGSASQPDDAMPWARSADADPYLANDDEDDVPSVVSREDTMARLRALGMGDDGASDAADSDGPRPGTGPAAARGLAGVGLAGGVGAAVGGAPGRDASAPAGRAAPARDDSDGRAQGGVGRLLGLARRPKAGSPRAARRVEKEPSWEKPRRFEAYPTLKTRVGLPAFSRLWLAAGAVVVAALILFFVPPLFLQQAGSGGPGATRTPAASDSGGVVASPARSTAPSTKPPPTQQTYTVKPGDTLSTIAKKFHVTVDQILAVNKTIKNPNKIAVGDKIVIPVAAPSEIIDSGTSASP